MKSDIEIARETDLRKIKEVATTLGIPREEVQNYGRYIAKVPIHLIDKKQMDQHNLILVTAITPTKAGIGKTTVSIGLALGLNKIGKKAVVALREPSLGPCFGMKGGAAGGGPGRIRRKGSGRAVQYAGQPGKCRRWICPSASHGKHQLAFYRGFSCGYFRPQYDYRFIG